jgi:2-polyprenyl-3-methyl-5-hydroxy-6-metoxy-1,4-benzoquinol methylase
MDYITGASVSPEKIKWMESYIPSVSGRALDIGCGAGLYLKWLKERGWTVSGLDLQPITTTEGIQISQHNLETGLPSVNQTFDLILAWDVLEHIKEDMKLWRDISKSLRPGGILLGSVPHRANEQLFRYNLTYKHHIDKTHQREYEIEDIRKNLNSVNLEEIASELKGPVSPQFLTEFISIKWARTPARYLIGIARRLGILKFGELYADIFFAAKRKSD